MQAGPRLALAPHHAHAIAGAERHRDDVADRDIEPGRHPVRIGLVERDRHQNIDDTLRHGPDVAQFRALKEG